MKTVKFVAVVAMLCMSFSVWAICPTKETMVMYINGVDVKESDALASAQKIRDELLKKGITEDCVKFGYVYNTNEPLFADWLEAAFQKADEFGQRPENFWRQWLRTVDGPVAFFFNAALDLLGASSRTVIDAGQWVLGDQKAEHIARYEKELDPNGLNRFLILVPHSQGNFYANEEYAALTTAQRRNTHIVATATPASFVADSNGPYISVNEDILVQTVFAAAGALAPNTPNLTERCQSDLASTNRWLCHGFKEEYLAEGKPSRDKIVADIIAALPTTPVPPSGVHYLRLVTGNPGVPGDGTLVNSGGIFGNVGFEPEPHFSLRGVTNGITVSAFPPNGTSVPFGHLNLQAAFTGKNVPTEILCPAGFGDGHISVPPVNGVAGVAQVLSQENLNTIVDFLSVNRPECGVATIDDLVVVGVFVDDNSNGANPFLHEMDAIAIGIGENAFPTDETPAP